MKQRIKKHTLSPAAARWGRRMGRDAALMRKLVTKNPGIQKLLALHRGGQTTESIWVAKIIIQTGLGALPVLIRQRCDWSLPSV